MPRLSPLYFVLRTSSFPAVWFIIALAGIAWLAYVVYLEHQRKVAKEGGAGSGLGSTLEEFARRLEKAEAERERLRHRVENLEAIVTSEPFDVDRAAKAALPATPGPQLMLGEAEAAGDEAEVARMARRVRGG